MNNDQQPFEQPSVQEPVQNSTQEAGTSEPRAFGPMIGIIVIVIVVILAGFYFWGQSMVENSDEINPVQVEQTEQQ